MRRVADVLSTVVLTACAAVFGVVLAPGVALAHTDIDYTLPADGEQAPQPVEEITVAFDDPVTLVGAGFEVLTPAGDIVTPSVFSEDGAVYFLEVPTALAGGVAAVRYEVAAADGHVLEGGFSFTVPAAPATTAPVTAAPATAAPATSTPGTPATVAPSVTTAPVVIAPAPTTAAVPAPTTAAVAEEDDGGGSSIGLVVGIVAAVAVAGVAFVILRARRDTPT